MAAQARRRTTKKAAPPGHRMTIIKWLTSKNTGDLLVIIIASTVCSMVIGAGFAVLLSWLFVPERDTSQIVSVISDVINTLVGLLAGFLAGRTDAAQTALKQAEAERETTLRMAETRAHVMTQANPNNQGALEP